MKSTSFLFKCMHIQGLQESEPPFRALSLCINVDESYSWTVLSRSTAKIKLSRATWFLSVSLVKGIQVLQQRECSCNAILWATEPYLTAAQTILWATQPYLTAAQLSGFDHIVGHRAIFNLCSAFRF